MIRSGRARRGACWPGSARARCRAPPSRTSRRAGPRRCGAAAGPSGRRSSGPPLVQRHEPLGRQRVRRAQRAGQDATGGGAGDEVEELEHRQRPARRSSSVSTSAGIVPRMPPPSMESTLIRRHAPKLSATTVLGCVPCAPCSPPPGVPSPRRQLAGAPGTPPAGTAVREPLHRRAEARELRCPDLVMRGPTGSTPTAGRRRAHAPAGGQLDRQRGAGPAELRGRASAAFMRGPPAHPTRGRPGGRSQHRRRLAVQVRPPAALLVEVPQRGPLRALAAGLQGQRSRRVRTGPKVAYCLRDLTDTRPRLRRSPSRGLPGLQHQPRPARVTLGTSSAGRTSIRRPTPSSGST